MQVVPVLWVFGCSRFMLQNDNALLGIASGLLALINSTQAHQFRCREHVLGKGQDAGRAVTGVVAGLDLRAKCMDSHRVLLGSMIIGSKKQLGQ